MAKAATSAKKSPTIKNSEKTAEALFFISGDYCTTERLLMWAGTDQQVFEAARLILPEESQEQLSLGGFPNPGEYLLLGAILTEKQKHYETSEKTSQGN